MNEDGWEWRYCSTHLNLGPRLRRVTGLPPNRFYPCKHPSVPVGHEAHCVLDPLAVYGEEKRFAYCVELNLNSAVVLCG